MRLATECSWPPMRLAIDAPPDLACAEPRCREPEARDLARDGLVDLIVAGALSLQLAMALGDVVVDLEAEAVDGLGHGTARPRRIEAQQALQTLAGQIQWVRHGLKHD